MQEKDLRDLVVRLTGKAVILSEEDSHRLSLEYAPLNKVISKKKLFLDWNEFNEILLSYNKRRITKGFFDFFFIKDKTDKKRRVDLKELEQGVQCFVQLAMLSFGNIIFAYRDLSRLDYVEIQNKLGRYVEKPTELLAKYKSRPRKLQEIKEISKKDIHLLGYISGGGIDIDLKTAVAIQSATENYIAHNKKQKLCKYILDYIAKNGVDFKQNVTHLTKERILDHTRRILNKYFARNPTVDVNKFFEVINKSLLSISKLNDRMSTVRAAGIMNTDIYLTWDHMDIYLATSMRREWEFQAFFNFVNTLFSDKKLLSLKLRYFDPTQSYDNSRIDKGLVEGLMLKRAKCTIYSIQDSDTFGKDSELAATLAQGKTVIAYIPEINVTTYTKELYSQPLNFFIHRIKLLYETFEKIEVKQECLRLIKNKTLAAGIKKEDDLERFLNDFTDEIVDFAGKKVWNSIETSWARDTDFKQKNKNNFDLFCYFMAIADKHFYNKRANDLIISHPLGLQVCLENGVANGVLVVRDIKECANLLYKILTNQVCFDLKKDPSIDCLYLRERITGCVYRVVSGDLKLTNSFWNFYLNN